MIKNEDQEVMQAYSDLVLDGISQSDTVQAIRQSVLTVRLPDALISSIAETTHLAKGKAKVPSCTVQARKARKRTRQIAHASRRRNR